MTLPSNAIPVVQSLARKHAEALVLTLTLLPCESITTHGGTCFNVFRWNKNRGRPQQPPCVRCSLLIKAKDIEAKLIEDPEIPSPTNPIPERADVGNCPTCWRAKHSGSCKDVDSIDPKSS